jgi:beta-glucosidase-like glycosyl hydrolase
MSMQSGLYREYLPGLAEEGTLSMETLDEAVRRVLDSKARMGATCKSTSNRWECTSWFCFAAVEIRANFSLM